MLLCKQKNPTENHKSTPSTIPLSCTGTGDPLWLNFAAKRIKGKELLIVVSNRPAHHALTTYRKRWAIECLFAEAKTRGNLEDTRLSSSKKLSLLIGLVALAMAWAAKIASAKIGARKRPRKSHGRYAKSIFRIGLDEIRRLLRTNPAKAFQHWPKSKMKIA
ncbi:MAG: transposase [Rhodobacterales bacterium]|nr:transposase [Rhodobacterales bacterium]